MIFPYLSKFIGSTLSLRVLHPREINKRVTRSIHVLLIISILVVNVSGAVLTASAAGVEPAQRNNISENVNDLPPLFVPLSNLVSPAPWVQ